MSSFRIGDALAWSDSGEFRKIDGLRYFATLRLELSEETASRMVGISKLFIGEKIYHDGVVVPGHILVVAGGWSQDHKSIEDFALVCSEPRIDGSAAHRLFPAANKLIKELKVTDGVREAVQEDQD